MRETEGWREEGVRATGEERAGKEKEDRLQKGEAEAEMGWVCRKRGQQRPQWRQRPTLTAPPQEAEGQH